MTDAQSRVPASAASSTIQVRLTTKTETPISSTPIVIPTHVTRYTLSQILNHLLENTTPVPYSFLVNSVYLPSSLDEYITLNGVSREEVLEIEYVRSVLPPQWEGRWSQDDWISGVSLGEAGVVTGGYDGLVRVWEWSGNVVARGRAGDGALRGVKCVRWIDGGSIVSGGMDGSVRVWSTQGGGVEVELEGKGHEASVDCVAYRDGKILSASSDGSLKLWSTDPEGENNPDTDPAKRKKRRTLKTHPTKVSP
jgi:ribosome biogenesis protein